MTKHKWKKFSCELKHEDLFRRINLRKFDNNIGFRVNEFGHDFLYATFIEKIVDVIKVTDPFGVVEENKTIRYCSFDFHLYLLDEFNSIYLLEIIEPPRTVRSMLNLLQEVLGNIFVEDVSISLLDFFNSIKKDSPRAKIIKIKASSIKISKNSQMRVEVDSIDDAYYDFVKFIEFNDYKIDKIKIENPFSKSTAPIEIGANGFLNIDESSVDEIRSLILGCQGFAKTC